MMHIWREASHVPGGDQARDPGENVPHAVDRPDRGLDRGPGLLAAPGREGAPGDSPGGCPGNGWEDLKGGPGE